MKNKLRIGAFFTAAVLVFAGCGSKAVNTSSAEGEKTGNTQNVDSIKVGFVAGNADYEDILNKAAIPEAASAHEFEIVNFDNTDDMNKALAKGEIDAAYGEKLYEIGGYADLADAGSIFIEPMGIYSSNIPSLNELDEGLTIGVPSDEEKQGRALLLLQSEGLITLNFDNPEAVNQTLDDVSVNDPAFSFQRYSDEVIPSVIYETDLAVMDLEAALAAGLKTEDALALEGEDSQYAVILAVKAENAESEVTNKLKSLFMNEEVAEYITTSYGDKMSLLF